MLYCWVMGKREQNGDFMLGRKWNEDVKQMQEKKTNRETEKWTIYTVTRRSNGNGQIIWNEREKS